MTLKPGWAEEFGRALSEKLPEYERQARTGLRRRFIPAYMKMPRSSILKGAHKVGKGKLPPLFREDEKADE